MKTPYGTKCKYCDNKAVMVIVKEPLCKNHVRVINNPVDIIISHITEAFGHKVDREKLSKLIESSPLIP